MMHSLVTRISTLTVCQLLLVSEGVFDYDLSSTNVQQFILVHDRQVGVVVVDSDVFDSLNCLEWHAECHLVNKKLEYGVQMIIMKVSLYGMISYNKIG